VLRSRDGQPIGRALPRGQVRAMPEGRECCDGGQLPVQTRVQAVRTGWACRAHIGFHRTSEGELCRVPDTTGRGGHVCGEQAQVQGGGRNCRYRVRASAD